MNALQDAIKLYEDRQARRRHPSGTFDRGGRWYPADAERQSCCAVIRRPSRAYPYSLLSHCRSAEHIAQLCGVDLATLREAIRRPAKREGGDEYFKIVALDGDRLLSIYDGQTEYKLGATMRERARQEHQGGFYCYASRAQAECADLPDDSAAANLPRVLLRVRAAGPYCRYGDKLAFSQLTPLEVIPR